MILETLQLISGSLTNATYGVNALIPSLTGSQPPLVNLVADETQNPDVARDIIPVTVPSLLVNLHQSGELDPMVNTTYRDGKIPVLIRYVGSKTRNDQVMSDAFRTLRVAEWSLRNFFHPTHAADRVLNNIQLLYLDRMEHVRAYQDVKDIVVTSGLIITVKARDINIPTV